MFQCTIIYAIIILHPIPHTFHCIFIGYSLYIATYPIILYMFPSINIYAIIILFPYFIPFFVYSLDIHYTLLSALYTYNSTTWCLSTPTMYERGGV